MKYFIRPWLFLHKCSMHWEGYRLPKYYTHHNSAIQSPKKRRLKTRIPNIAKDESWTMNSFLVLSFLWNRLNMTQSQYRYSWQWQLSLCGFTKILKLLLEIKGLMVFTFLICLNLPTFCAPCFWNYSPGVPWQCISKLVFHLSVMCPVHPERISSPYAHFTLCLV